MSANHDEVSAELVRAVESMPAFPKSAHRILQLTRDAACAPKDLIVVIENDPIVTVKVLRVVNSVHFNLPKKITSIAHAVVFLGLNTIKNLSLSLATVSMLPTNPQLHFDGQSYLLHSLTAAGVARQLGMQLQAGDPNDYFIGGLLHDFGKVVIAQGLPAAYRKAHEYSIWHEVSLHQALMAAAGIDHSAVGAMLLERWQFPADLVHAVRTQHQVSEDDGELTFAIVAANQICKELGIDFGGAPHQQPLPECVEKRLGGTLDQIISSLGDMAPILEEAKRFSSL